jgi:hypothetical protein
VLVNPNNRLVSEADIRRAQTAAQRLGLVEVIVVNGGTEKEIETGALAIPDPLATASMSTGRAVSRLDRRP